MVSCLPGVPPKLSTYPIHWHAHALPPGPWGIWSAPWGHFESCEHLGSEPARATETCLGSVSRFMPLSTMSRHCIWQAPRPVMETASTTWWRGGGGDSRRPHHAQQHKGMCKTGCTGGPRGTGGVQGVQGGWTKPGSARDGRFWFSLICCCFAGSHTRVPFPVAGIWFLPVPMPRRCHCVALWPGPLLLAPAGLLLCRLLPDVLASALRWVRWVHCLSPWPIRRQSSDTIP